MNDKKLYTVNEAVSLFDEVSEYTIWKGIHAGTIKSIKIGRRYYVTKESVYNGIYRDFLGESEEFGHNEIESAE